MNLLRISSEELKAYICLADMSLERVSDRAFGETVVLCCGCPSENGMESDLRVLLMMSVIKMYCDYPTRDETKIEDVGKLCV